MLADVLGVTPDHRDVLAAASHGRVERDFAGGRVTVTSWLYRRGAADVAWASSGPQDPEATVAFAQAVLDAAALAKRCNEILDPAVDWVGISDWVQYGQVMATC